jgi:hypothetical protein
MSKFACYIDVFTSGLDEMKRKDQGDVAKVLAVLKAHGRFSVFEATHNQTIAKTMDHICSKGLVVVDKERSAYPWTYVTLADAGESMLKGSAK